jgi:hypothetical protein
MRRIFLSGGGTSRGLRVQHLTHLGPTPIPHGVTNMALDVVQVCRKLPYDPHLYPRLCLQQWLMVNPSHEWIFPLHLQLYGSTALILPGLLSLPGIALFPRVLMPPYYTAEVVAADIANALVAHHLHPALSTQLH